MSNSDISTIVCPASLDRCRMVEAALLPFDDGRLYLAYSAGVNANFTKDDIRILGRWSHDEGKSWTEPFLVQEYDGNENVMEPSFHRLSSGRVIQTYQQRGGYFADGERFGDLYPMVMWSDDECETWSKPIRITGDANIYFSTNDRLVPLSGGRLLLPVLVAPEMNQVSVWISDDDGQSWRKGGDITAGDGMTFGYPMAAELDNETVAMFLLNSSGAIHTAHSSDGGESWESVNRDGPSPCPATFMVRRIPDSPDLLLIWNNHTERTNLTSAISRDNGVTWSNYRSLEPQESHPVHRTHAFPSLAFMNGFAHMTYYERTANAQTEWMFDLVYRRLPVSWFYEQSVRREIGRHTDVFKTNPSGIPYEPTAFRQMGVTDAWRKYAERLEWGRGQTLAILDDGCDLTVPEWTTPLPWGAPKVVAGYDSIEQRDDPSPIPPGYHGTSVGYPSSLNAGGRFGVAFNNQVVHIRGITIVHLRQDESETMARGLQWVIDHHEEYTITAVNLSPVDDQAHDNPWPTAIDSKLEQLRNLNVWVSAPCANNGFTNGISWPACQPFCFAIGATRPDEDVAHLDRYTNTDILVPASATSSSNAQIAGAAMVLREAIEKAEFDWEAEADNLPDAMMSIFRKTSLNVFDQETDIPFKRLDFVAALDYVFQ